MAAEGRLRALSGGGVRVEERKEDGPMMDKIFATISMLGFIAFLGIVSVYVREPDLIIVTVVVIAIGVIYIWRDVAAGGQGAIAERLDNKDD